MDKINVYVCNKGHRTVTENLLLGNIPLFILCREDGCKEKALSQQYHVDQNQDADWEFYKPDPIEAKKEMRTMLENFDISRAEYNQAIISLNNKIKRGELLLRKKKTV